MTGIVPRLLATARRMIEDETGSSTIEFLLWLPLLTFWLVFSVTAFAAWDSRSDAAKAAYAIADIVSRMETIDRDLLDQVEDLHANLVRKRSGDDQLRITSLVRVGKEIRIQWSCGLGDLTPLNPGSVDLDDVPVMAPLDTVIMVESQVPYETITAWAGAEKFSWDSILFVRPRLVREILFAGTASACRTNYDEQEDPCEKYRRKSEENEKYREKYSECLNERDDDDDDDDG